MKWRLLFAAAVVTLFVVGAAAQQKTTSHDWPGFRGPNGSGLGKTTGLPLEFGKEKNVVWKKALPTGHSSPVLTDKYIFLTACEEEKLLTLCLDRNTGRILWQKEAPRPRQQKVDFRNNPASPSPVTDGRRVFVYFADFGLLAYDFRGKELWQLPLGPFENTYGMGASPILADNKVILVCDQTKDSYILAADAGSGAVVWKKARPEAKSGHSTPIVYTPKEGETQVLVPGSFLLTAYSAGTGEKIWWTGGLSFEMKSTPVIHDGILYINGYASPLNQPENQVQLPSFTQALAKFDADGNKLLSKEELPQEPIYQWFGFVDVDQDGHLDADDWDFFNAAAASLNGMLAIRLGGKGDVTKTHTVWHYRRSVPQLPSPLVYRNVLYMLNDGGYVTTFNPANGEVIQKGRIKGSGAKFFASPVAADDKVFLTSLKGKVTVLKPGGSLEVAALNDLKEDCYATPALVDGRIYLRTVSTLYCFGLNK